MWVGDEYALFRVISGDVPEFLRRDKLVVPPAVMTRLSRAFNRLSSASASHGQITSRLNQLTPETREIILNPAPQLCTTLQPADIAEHYEAVTTAAGHIDLAITPYTAELIAAARLHNTDTVWTGLARNIPAKAIDRNPILGVYWQPIESFTVTVIRARPSGRARSREL